MRLPRHRQVHLAVTVLAGVAAFGLGLLFGALSPGREDPVVERTGGPGPWSESDGVGVGFERSPQGAAAAVASYQRAFATPAILRRPVLERRIRIVATPEYVTTMLRANSPGARRIGSGPIGIGAREGLQTLYASVPVGYRIASYSPARAVVITWGFTLLGNAASVPPQAYFGIARTTLAWRGDWKIGAVRSGFGPTPEVETGGREVGGFDLIELARGLRSYAGAP
jgi:hypothetical protein